ncbi:MAG: hypothetical protein E7395_06750 [Ruminococcaceae bacterium]|nr:hypothetical protein [Oscillospiraceae bacterium]
MNTLKIGWSETDITPSKKVSLAGQFAERISQYIEKPLTATAFAVESGNEQMIMVSCDLVSVTWKLLCDVREALKDNTLGIDPEKIIISAIHTHTAYRPLGGQRCQVKGVISNYRTMLDGFLRPDQKYIEKENVSTNPDVATTEENHALLIEKLPKLIKDAWQNRTNGSFSNAFGRAAIGMCRRAAYTDGTAQMWGDTNTAVFTELEGGNDSGIELMFALDPDKKVTGIVVNLACPAQCVQHRLFVSPDFWGEVKVRLRKYFGEDIFMLPLCSAAGDQCPVDLIRWVEPESDLNDPNCKRNNPPKRKADPSMFDLAGMVKAGKRIANEIIDVYEEGLDEAQSSVNFEHRIVNMKLPIRRATLTEVNKAKEAIKAYLATKGNIDYNDVANLQIHLGILKRFELQEQLDTLTTEIHVVRMGTVAIASNPFELFLDYGNQIKARSSAEQTFLVQLANGAEGYLPTAKAEANGHYSAFIGSGQVGHIGGDLLVRETLQNIREMFE